MKSPITGKEMVWKQELVKNEFRKETFDVVYQYYLCEDTGEKFEDERLAQLNLDQVYHQYRLRHGLPFPEQIIELREQYGLSAAKMAEVLRFGINVYRNYETGEIPNGSNALILDFASDPAKFKDMVLSSDALTGKERERVLEKVEQLIYKQNLISFDLKNYFMGEPVPDEESGYRKPSLDKFAEMVVFFAGENQPYKTKLNKLLFYADYYNFKRTGMSISGGRYRAIDMGPVPNNFHSIFEYLEQKNYVKVVRKLFTNSIGEQFTADTSRPFNPNVFSEDEMDTLKKIAARFGGMTTQQIIDISHEEEAWEKKFTNGRQLMNYLDGFKLKAI